MHFQKHKFKKLKLLPGSKSNCLRSSILSTVPDLGECKTIIVEPIMHKKHPIFPSKFNFSPRYFEDKMALKNKCLIRKHA